MVADCLALRTCLTVATRKHISFFGQENYSFLAGKCNCFYVRASNSEERTLGENQSLNNLRDEIIHTALNERKKYSCLTRNSGDVRSKA